MLEAALNTVSIGYEGANKYKVRVAHKSIVAACLHWFICAQVPKFPQIPAEIVPTIVAYAFHTGWY